MMKFKRLYVVLTAMLAIVFATIAGGAGVFHDQDVAVHAQDANTKLLTITYFYRQADGNKSAKDPEWKHFFISRDDKTPISHYVETKKEGFKLTRIEGGVLDTDGHTRLPKEYVASAPASEYDAVILNFVAEDAITTTTTKAPTTTTKEPTTTKIPTTTEATTTSAAPTTTEATTTSAAPTTTEATTTSAAPTTTEATTTSVAPTTMEVTTTVAPSTTREATVAPVTTTKEEVKKAVLPSTGSTNNPMFVVVGLAIFSLGGAAYVFYKND